MRKYSVEFKESVIEQLVSPEPVSLHEISEKTGVPFTTLQEWRKIARRTNRTGIGDNETSRNWSSEDKFKIVLEAAAMNEEERNGFCRNRGIFPEQIDIWREACISANADQSAITRELRGELREEKNKVRELERNLRRKEKALAEAAALLVLRKKVEAIWGEEEDE